LVMGPCVPKYRIKPRANPFRAFRSRPLDRAAEHACWGHLSCCAIYSSRSCLAVVNRGVVSDLPELTRQMRQFITVQDLRHPPEKRIIASSAVPVNLNPKRVQVGDRTGMVAFKWVFTARTTVNRPSPLLSFANGLT
jgi:hypothetical protein